MDDFLSCMRFCCQSRPFPFDVKNQLFLHQSQLVNEMKGGKVEMKIKLYTMKNTKETEEILHEINQNEIINNSVTAE